MPRSPSPWRSLPRSTSTWRSMPLSVLLPSTRLPGLVTKGWPHRLSAIKTEHYINAADQIPGTVIARTSVTTRTSVTFGCFTFCPITSICVTFLMMLKWLKILKNNVNSNIYSYFNILHFLYSLFNERQVKTGLENPGEYLYSRLH
jgi:hypothetical protein